jgi:DNA-binding NarL/FixJ family response regulator
VHVRRIMKKLHAANRTQAALAAQQMADAVA